MTLFRQQKIDIATLFILLACSACGDRVEQSSSTKKRTSSPPLVFGILSQPFYEDEYDDSNKRNPDDRGYNRTYIAASYVKWLEDGGARSIPIPFDASPSLVEDILDQVDGVLFPGGASALPSSAIAIWEVLHGEKYYFPEKDDAPRDMIPLWGTCLGMEFIIQLAADATENDCGYRCNQDILEKGYDSTNISLPLLGVNRSGLYRPDSVYDIVTGFNVTMNNHHLGISPERFRNNSGLSQRFDVTSINYDLNGKAFVSTIEPSNRHVAEFASSSSSKLVAPPVYGVQYHPEKNTHEYGFYPRSSIPYESIDHSPEGIDFSLYEARFLVNLARENIENRGGDFGQNVQGIGKYNKPDLYPMIYTYPRKVGYKFEERYIIPLVSHWKREINVKKNDDSYHQVEDRGENLVTRKGHESRSMLRRKSQDPLEE